MYYTEVNWSLNFLILLFHTGPLRRRRTNSLVGYIAGKGTVASGVMDRKWIEPNN